MKMLLNPIEPFSTAQSEAPAEEMNQRSGFSLPSALPHRVPLDYAEYLVVALLPGIADALNDDYGRLTNI